MKKNKKAKKIKKYTIKNFQIFMISVWVIMIWRWVWNFLDHYVFPESFIFSNILTIFVWVIILMYKDFDLKELK